MKKVKLWLDGINDQGPLVFMIHQTKARGKSMVTPFYLFLFG